MIGMEFVDSCLNNLDVAPREPLDVTILLDDGACELWILQKAWAGEVDVAVASLLYHDDIEQGAFVLQPLGDGKTTVASTKHKYRPFTVIRHGRKLLTPDGATVGFTG